MADGEKVKQGQRKIDPCKCRSKREHGEKAGQQEIDCGTRSGRTPFLRIGNWLRENDFCAVERKTDLRDGGVKEAQNSAVSHFVQKTG